MILNLLSRTSLPGRWLAATLLVLASALRPAGARAQTPTITGLQIQSAPPASATSTHIILDGPRPTGPLPVIYLDGQRCDSAAIAKINPDTVATVSILSYGAVARRLGPAEARLGVIFITTKAGEHSHRVQAFNRRLVRLQRAETRTISGQTAP